MDIHTKDIYSNSHNKNNLVISQASLILWHDYKKLKTKIQNYNSALKLLTLKVLNSFTQKNTVAKSHYAKYDNQKITYKNKNKQYKKEKLWIMKKLLLINLKSLQIMEIFCKKNCDLQNLNDKSYQCMLEQKQPITKIKNENDYRNEKKNFKIELEHFFPNFNKTTDKILFDMYFETDHINYFIPQLYNKDKFIKDNLQLTPKITPKFITFKMNLNDKFDNIKENFKTIRSHKEILFSCDINVTLKPSKICSYFEDLNYPKYFYLNMWPQNKDYINKKLLKENRFKELHYPETKIENIHFQQNRYKDIVGVDIYEKNILPEIFQNFDSLILKNFPFSNLIIKLPVPISLKKQELLIGPKFEEINILNSDIKNLLLFDSTKNRFFNNDRKAIKHNIIEFKNQDTYNILNKEKIKTDKKLMQGIINISLKSKKLSKILFTNYLNLKYEISNNFIETNQIDLYKENIVTEVDDHSTLLLNQGSQVKNRCYTEKIENTVNKVIDNLNKIETELPNEVQSRQKLNTWKKNIDTSNDFKNSLKDLKKIIEFYEEKIEQDDFITSNTSLKFQRKKKHYNVNIPVEKSYKNITNDTKSQKNHIQAYESKNYTLNKMPDMGKIYRIVLENKMSQGISFEFVTSNKTNIQMLFVSNRHKNHIKN